MHNRPRLIRKYTEELKRQDRVYQPGVFWENALNAIGRSYATNGIANFRRDKVNLNFFVPTYGVPGNGFEENKIRQIRRELKPLLNFKQKQALDLIFEGSLQALSDYRTFIAGNNVDDIFNNLDFTESDIGNPYEHFTYHGKKYSRSSLNYLLGLTCLKKLAPDFNPKVVLEIGGGFGTLGEILLKSNLQNFKYIDLDLPPLFLIAEEYLKNINHNEEYFFSHEDAIQQKINIESLPKFSFLPNWKIECLIGSIDLFVNFISFQEMEPEIVKNYVKKIEKLQPKYVLLRNLKEGKQIHKEGHLGVRTPILSEDYIKFFESYVLLERNTIPFGYITPDSFHSEILILKKK